MALEKQIVINTVQYFMSRVSLGLSAVCSRKQLPSLILPDWVLQGVLRGFFLSQLACLLTHILCLLFPL